MYQHVRILFLILYPSLFFFQSENGFSTSPSPATGNSLTGSAVADSLIKGKNKDITYLYGTKAIRIDGSVTREGGDYLKFTGPARLTWRVDITAPGAYHIELNHGVKSNETGNQIEIISGNQKAVYQLIPTSGVWGDGSFEKIRIKPVLNLKAGVNEISLIIPQKSAGEPVLTLRSLDLLPVRALARLKANHVKAHNSRSETFWLNKAAYGLMFHWTSQSVMPDGSQKKIFTGCS